MDNTFGIIPASSGMYIFLWSFGIIMAVILLGLIGLFAFFGYQANHLSVTVNEQGLDISPGMYSRFIPKENIDVSGVKVLNLELDKDYQLKVRTNGGGFPGYSVGWFKLQNQEKALAFVTDRSSVIYIPTTENFSVLFSVREADLMKEKLQNWK
jgi:hypothetical protein